MLICLYCGFKICQKCINIQAKHTKNNHLNTAVFIKVENGDHQYRYGEYNLKGIGLYTNYIGEGVQDVTAKFERNQYLLNMEKYDKIIDDVIRDRIK